MSLLMDALKRAEEAKRQNAAPGTARTPEEAAGRTPTPAQGSGLEMSLEPAPPLPEMSERLTEVDAELRATASRKESQYTSSPRPQTPVPASEPASATADGQAAARNMFSAKNQNAGASSGRRTIVALAAIGGIAALAIGGYFSYQYQQLSGAGSKLATVTVARPAATPPDSTPAPAAPSSALPAPPAAAPAPPPPAVTGTPGAPAAAAAKSAEPIAPAARRSGLPATTRTAPATPRTPARETAAGASDSPIRVSTGSQKINPALNSGYQSLQSGDFDGARGAYEQVLRGDPRNTDALTGLAAIAARQGQTERAQTLYAQTLTADPKNVAALTGLIGLQGQGDPILAESRLKSMLAGQAPDSAQAGMIQFALGNLYAVQRRWNEAQNAYFQAYAADGGNPDYHYNLAVSLDHLQQDRLAAQFYRSALAAANGRQAAFDHAQTQARLAELQR